jgi:hypothetical protein
MTTILSTLFRGILGKPDEDMKEKYGDAISTLHEKLQGLQAVMAGNSPQQGILSIIGFIRLVDDWNQIATGDKNFKMLLKKANRISASDENCKLLCGELEKLNTLCKEILDNLNVTINKNLDGNGKISTHSVLIKTPGITAWRTVNFLNTVRAREEYDAGVFCTEFIQKNSVKLIDYTEKIKSVFEKMNVPVQ